MQKKLTITIDQAVYEGLYRAIGPRRISQFIEALLRPHVVAEELDRSYSQMASDEAREDEATQWTDALIQDIADEAR